ncbi:MAG: hypothetical protein MZV70_46370 [Desulfobacterales bacterium]|nr:hypothetical protein [Desulfobacterales bacterium]
MTASTNGTTSCDRFLAASWSGAVQDVVDCRRRRGGRGAFGRGDRLRRRRAAGLEPDQAADRRQRRKKRNGK